MHFQRIITEGLAHYSYLIGAGGKAVVIDPRRDCDVYLEEARRAGLQIIYVLETHRHEDLVLGSVELAARSSVEVWHADSHLPYEYGQPLREGQEFHVGELSLETIASPGHTAGGISYLLRDPSGSPWMLFSGDTLLAGATGRTDLAGPDRTEEMTALLYETLFRRLLVLGDDILLWPAHGAGTICARAAADRPWTTIGMERRLNPVLSLSDGDSFMKAAGRSSDLPPYFRLVETLNVKGAPPLRENSPTLVPPRGFADAAPSSQVIDIEIRARILACARRTLSFPRADRCLSLRRLVLGCDSTDPCRGRRRQRGCDGRGAVGAHGIRQRHRLPCWRDGCVAHARALHCSNRRDHSFGDLPGTRPWRRPVHHRRSRSRRTGRPRAGADGAPYRPASADEPDRRDTGGKTARHPVPSRIPFDRGSQPS